MNVSLCLVELLLDTTSDFKGAGLVVGTVGTRNELLVFFLEWEPGLEIDFLGGSIVQCPRDDGAKLLFSFAECSSKKMLGSSQVSKS